MNFAGKPAGFSTTLLPKPRKGRLPSTIFTGAALNDQIIRSFGLGTRLTHGTRSSSLPPRRSFLPRCW